MNLSEGKKLIKQKKFSKALDVLINLTQQKNFDYKVFPNLGLEDGLKKLGYKFVRSDVGDKYVSEMLSKKGWMLGGETSGHIICKDLVSTGDGTIAALKVLEKIILDTIGNFTKDIRIFSVGFETTYQLKKLSYTNILQANNSSQSLHNLIVINTKKEDYGLWIAAKNRSVEFEKNLLNNNRKIEIIEGYSLSLIHI